LRLAATPTFVLMAMLTNALEEADRATCLGTGASPLSSMGLMYLLMSGFHAGPWVTLASRK
jgi:hypothetical protein